MKLEEALGGMIHGQGEKEQTAEGGIQMKCGDRVVRDPTSGYGKLSGVVHNVHFPAPGRDKMFELVTDQGQHYIFPEKELRMEVLGDVFPPGSPPNKRLEKNLKEGMIHGQGEKVTTEHGAVREANTGRGRFDLLPYEALEAYAIWSELGAEKYGDRNWESGLSVKDCINRLVRHAVKAGNGWTDEDHLAACMWNAAAAITMIQRRPDCNDQAWAPKSNVYYIKPGAHDEWKKAIPRLTAKAITDADEYKDGSARNILSRTVTKASEKAKVIEENLAYINAMTVTETIAFEEGGEVLEKYAAFRKALSAVTLSRMCAEETTNKKER